MIELRNFRKRYGRLTAVDRLTMKIAPGEVFGFIGPNGAGKSTTIRFLATLLRASEGEGFVAGHSVDGDPPAVRRSIGYMPDSFGFFAGMKVRGFLDFCALGYRIPRDRRRRAVGEVMDLLELNDLADAPVGSLSRGMKQRLALAKTLVHDPPVLILDEPANALDPRARVELKTLLRRLGQAGKTILISSHVLAELADCCSTIGIIDRGKLLAHGPIEQVFARVRKRRRLRIKFLEGVEAGARLIGNLPEAQNLRVEENLLSVELRADDRRLADLLEQLPAAGARVVSFTEEEPTLEDLFLAMTAGC